MYPTPTPLSPRIVPFCKWIYWQNQRSRKYLVHESDGIFGKSRLPTKLLGIPQTIPYGHCFKRLRVRIWPHTKQAQIRSWVKIYVHRKAEVKPRLTFGQSPQYWHFYQFWPHCVIFSTKMEWQWITFITFLSLNVSASAQHFSHKNDHSSYFLRKCEKIHRCLAGILKCRSFKLRTAKSCQCFSQSPPRFITSYLFVCVSLQTIQNT